MRKWIFLTIVFFSAKVVTAQVDRDKALHFIGGNLYGLAGAGIAKQISDGNRWWTFAGAIGGSTLIGLGKEAVDSGQEGNSWDNDDLLATILGGATVGVTIDIFTDKKRKRRRLGQGIRFSANQELEFKQNARLLELLEQQKTPSLTTLSLPAGFMDRSNLEK